MYSYLLKHDSNVSFFNWYTLTEAIAFTGGTVLVADESFRRLYRLSNVLCIGGIELDVGSQGSIFMFKN